jgi:hypothetical protein
MSKPADNDVWPHTSRPMPWVLAGFLAMIWLVPFDSMSLPVSLPLDARLDRPVLIGIAGLWVLSLVGVNTVTRLRVSRVHMALLLFLIIAAVSLVHNDATIVRLGDLDIALKKLALLVSYILLFVIVASSIKATEVPNFIKLMLGLACITGVGALIEYRLGYNAFFNWSEKILPVTRPGELGAVDSIGRKSIIGPTIHPLAVAMMMSLTLPFALVGFLSATERKPKIWYGLAVVIMFAAALATQRKTSLVAPAFGLIMLMAYRPNALKKLVPVALVLFVLIHAIAPGAIGGVGDQLKPKNLFGVMSTKDRQSDYGAIKPDVIKYPLIGRGYESYDQKKYRILDNQYLTTVIGTGALGILAYLGIFGSILSLAHRIVRSRDPVYAPLATGASCAIASLVVGSMLLDVFALPQLPYLICFIGALVVVVAQTQVQEKLQATARRRVPVPRALPEVEPAPANALLPRLVTD